MFSTGAGTYGQLGHGSVQNDFLPRMVAELMGTTCTQISTGRRHTLTFVPSRGRIYGFGLGCSGQLGNRSSKNSSVPQVVVGKFLHFHSATQSILLNFICHTQRSLGITEWYVFNC